MNECEIDYMHDWVDDRMLQLQTHPDASSSLDLHPVFPGPNAAARKHTKLVHKCAQRSSKDSCRSDHQEVIMKQGQQEEQRPNPTSMHSAPKSTEHAQSDQACVSQLAARQREAPPPPP